MARLWAGVTKAAAIACCIELVVAGIGAVVIALFAMFLIQIIGMFSADRDGITAATLAVGAIVIMAGVAACVALWGAWRWLGGSPRAWPRAASVPCLLVVAAGNLAGIAAAVPQDGEPVAPFAVFMGGVAGVVGLVIGAHAVLAMFGYRPGRGPASD